MGFTLKERQILGIHGLLPPSVFSQDDQAIRVLANFRRWVKPIDKYVYLSALMDRNEKLFYKVIAENIEEMAPIIYTPTVGKACEHFGFIFRKPRWAGGQGQIMNCFCECEFFAWREVTAGI